MPSRESAARPILLKSTVPPGTSDRFAADTGKQICYRPEYMGQSRVPQSTFPILYRRCTFRHPRWAPKIRQWFIDKLLPVLGPTKRHFQCHAVDAELIKYAENAFLSLKICFVHEYRRICETFGSDWHTVPEGWLIDPRVSPMHTAAFADDPGFDGGCLPKDLEAIVAAARSVGYEAPLLRHVHASNELLRSGRAAGISDLADECAPESEPHRCRASPFPRPQLTVRRRRPRPTPGPGPGWRASSPGSPDRTAGIQAGA
jgi:UDP-glucose 6-dehydrogenase